MIPHIEIGSTCLLDKRTPVKVLKALNRSKTAFSIEMPDKSIDTVSIERLQPDGTDELLSLDVIDLEPATHSMPEISND